MSKEENKNGLNSEQLECQWCNHPMTLATCFEKTVCVNCYRKLTAAGLTDKEVFNHEFSVFSKINKKDPTLEDSINRELEEIAKHHLIPFEIRPILKNVLAVKIDVENSFSDAEKDVLPYLKIKSSIDSQTAKLLRLCQRK